jgi:hypothetical protein
LSCHKVRIIAARADPHNFQTQETDLAGTPWCGRTVAAVERAFLT